jgi:hypothetical protein
LRVCQSNLSCHSLWMWCVFFNWTWFFYSLFFSHVVKKIVYEKNHVIKLYEITKIKRHGGNHCSPNIHYIVDYHSNPRCFAFFFSYFFFLFEFLLWFFFQIYFCRFHLLKLRLLKIYLRNLLFFFFVFI